MSSKQKPLWLEFTVRDAPDEPLVVPPKLGDDLRQDQLTLRLIAIMDLIWKNAGLDLCMSPYGCVSMGDEAGVIEIVLNSKTVSSIVAEASGSRSRLRRSYVAATRRKTHFWTGSPTEPVAPAKEILRSP